VTHAAAAETVVAVAVQACRRGTGVFVGDQRGRVDLVLERPVVIRELDIEVAVARADQRIIAVYAGYFRRAAGVQVSGLAQLVSGLRCIIPPSAQNLW
jgi:hypothetical protein